MCSEWVVLDLVGTEEVVDVVSKEQVQPAELPVATEQLLPTELLEEEAQEEPEEPEEEVLASVERRADPEEDLVDLEAFLLAQERAARGAEDPVTEEESAKDAAQAKFDKKAKNMSFGHTLRAKRHLA